MLFVAAGLALSLTGCMNTNIATSHAQVVAKYVDLPDGSKVLCVFWVPSDSSGMTTDSAQLSCNWAGVTK